MQIRKKIKNHFRVIVMLILLIGMLPVGINGLPGQASVVEAATNIKLNKTNATLIKGQTVQLKLNGARGKIAWSSSNKKIAVVNAAGKVTAKAKGATVIRAKFRNKIYTCKILVETPQINKTSITLYTNGSYTLRMLGTRQKVTWRSSRASVAAVNSKGKVIARKTGTAVITATVSNKRYVCKVVVKQKQNPTNNTGKTEGTVGKEENEMEIIPNK